MGKYYSIEPSSESECTIIFRMEQEVREDEIPECILNIRDEVNKLNSIIRIVFKDDDLKQKESFNTLIDIAQYGLGSEEVYPKQIQWDLENMRTEISKIYLLRKKQNQIIKLVIISLLVIGVNFFAIYIANAHNKENIGAETFEIVQLFFGSYIGMIIVYSFSNIKFDLESVATLYSDFKTHVVNIIITSLVSFIIYSFVKEGLFNINILGKQLDSLLKPGLPIIIFGFLTGSLSKPFMNKILFQIANCIK